MSKAIGFIPMCCDNFGTKGCLVCSCGNKCKKLFRNGYDDFKRLIYKYNLERLIVSSEDFLFSVEPLSKDSEVVRFE